MAGVGTRCYLHDREKQIKNNSLVDQYVKIDTCPPENVTTPIGPCVPQFVVLEDKASIGGILDEELTELDQCFKKCNDDEECVGFDYNPDKDFPCWFFFDNQQMVNGEGVRQGITQYRIKVDERCVPGEVDR